MSKFNWRSFVSFSLVISFVIIFFTGVFLYFAPVGKVARWIDWRVLGLTKAHWEEIHTVFSYLFTVFAVFHLFTFNWKVFYSYIRKKAEKGFNRKKEFGISFILIVVIFIASIFSIPPVNFVMDFGDKLSDSWQKEEQEPPVSGAEKYTLEEFVNDLVVNWSTVDSLFKVNEIKYKDKSQTIAEIASENRISPFELYLIIDQK